eukprot:CAMPEP_0116028686 /NCGR_PEP_ID=MMETSP0321-20121206/15600_1 /TAXON_ID=163516 /ORGANISM="Leptocylindrus danicus var. danicus, Strain B650" /LENGTH=843 /DNA_ID=CAMNT_0003502735 /DNA_START=282 /DNA_END=2812 /DNA_ORIENTATION=+
MNEYDDGIDWSQVPDTCTQHENLAQENVHPPCSQFQNNYPDGSSNYDLQQHSRGGASTIETITNNQNEAGWMKEEIRRLKTQLEAKNEEAFDLRVSLCAVLFFIHTMQYHNFCASNSLSDPDFPLSFDFLPPLLHDPPAAVESEARVAQKLAIETANSKIRTMEEEVQRYKQEARKASASLASQLHQAKRQKRQNDDQPSSSNGHPSLLSQSYQAVTPSPGSVSVAKTRIPLQAKVNDPPVEPKREVKSVSVMTTNLDNRSTQIDCNKSAKQLAQHLLLDGEAHTLLDFPFSFLPSAFISNENRYRTSIGKHTYTEVYYCLQGMFAGQVSIESFMQCLVRSIINLATSCTAPEERKPCHKPPVPAPENQNEMNRPASASSATMNSSGGSQRQLNESEKTLEKKSERKSEKRKSFVPLHITERDAIALLLVRTLGGSVGFSREARRWFCNMFHDCKNLGQNDDMSSTSSVFSRLKLCSRLTEKAVNNALSCIHFVTPTQYENVENGSKIQADDQARVFTQALQRIAFVQEINVRRDFRCSSVKLFLQYEVTALVVNLFSWVHVSKGSSLWVSLVDLFFSPLKSPLLDCGQLCSNKRAFSGIVTQSNIDSILTLQQCLHRCRQSPCSSAIYNLNLVTLELLKNLSKSCAFLTRIISNDYGERLISVLMQQVDWAVRNLNGENEDKVNKLTICLKITSLLNILCQQEDFVILLARKRSYRSKSLERKKTGIDIMSNLLQVVASAFTLRGDYAVAYRTGAEKKVGCLMLGEVVLFFSFIFPYAQEQEKESASFAAIVENHKESLYQSLSLIIHSNDIGMQTINDDIRFEASLLVAEMEPDEDDYYYY